MMHIVEFKSEGYKIHGKITQLESSKNTNVIILHPHPLYGGNMENHVVTTLERIFVDEDFTTFRFDFRGAPSSPQGYSGIDSAITDALNAIEFLESNKDNKYTAIVGYSFGASTAIRLALLKPPPFLITLSASKYLILEDGFDIAQLINIECPTMMFHGKSDSMIPFTDLYDIAKAIRSEPIKIELLDGEGHFYQRSLPIVESSIRDFIATLYD
ncbi:MAG: alpha/beta hydrolase [Candidatus Thorarchaeota archaeon]